jgi:hypothetical protein
MALQPDPVRTCVLSKGTWHNCHYQIPILVEARRTLDIVATRQDLSGECRSRRRRYASATLGVDQSLKSDSLRRVRDGFKGAADNVRLV